MGIRNYVKAKAAELATTRGGVWAQKQEENSNWPSIACDVGGIPDISFVSICDMIVIFEDSADDFLTFQTPQWIKDYSDKSMFIAMIKNADPTRLGQSMSELLDHAATLG